MFGIDPLSQNPFLLRMTIRHSSDQWGIRGSLQGGYRKWLCFLIKSSYLREKKLAGASPSIFFFFLHQNTDNAQLCGSYLDTISNTRKHERPVSKDGEAEERKIDDPQWHHWVAEPSLWPLTSNLPVKWDSKYLDCLNHCYLTHPSRLWERFMKMILLLLCHRGWNSIPIRRYWGKLYQAEEIMWSLTGTRYEHKIIL